MQTFCKTNTATGFENPSPISVFQSFLNCWCLDKCCKQFVTTFSFSTTNWLLHNKLSTTTCNDKKNYPTSRLGINLKRPSCCFSSFPSFDNNSKATDLSTSHQVSSPLDFFIRNLSSVLLLIISRARFIAQPAWSLTALISLISSTAS